jgi:hypothetical protein
VPIPIGTGLFKLLLHPPKPANEHRDRRVRLLDTI